MEQFIGEYDAYEGVREIDSLTFLSHLLIKIHSASKYLLSVIAVRSNDMMT